MGVSKHGILGVSVCLAALVLGCATTPEGPTTEDFIMGTLNSFKTGLEALDIDKMMTCFSEDFSSNQIGGKDELRTVLEDYKNGGDLNNARVDMAVANFTTLEDGTISVFPVDVRTDAGMAVLEFKVKQDMDGVWRAVDMVVNEI